MTYQLPPLPYPYEALEPVISAEIMKIHHQKHHQAYVTNLNAALEKYASAEKEGHVDEMIALQGAIRFNGGGHLNHSLFWEHLCSPGSGGEPEGELLAALKASFGSFDAFKEQFTAKTVAIQGSGWGWLAYHPQKKSLEIAVCANQDPPALLGLIPLLGADVWEHAYYLQYKNVRADYVKALWQIVNWNFLNKKFKNLKG